MANRINVADEIAFVVNNATTLRARPADELTVGMPVTQLFYSDRSVWVITGIRGKAIDLHRAEVKFADSWADGTQVVVRDADGNIKLNNSSAVREMTVTKFRGSWYQMDKTTGTRYKSKIKLAFGVADGYRDPHF